jgi:glyoxylase-like metal-dependent hydrolase (beta-lactamase superfamily II)
MAVFDYDGVTVWRERARLGLYALDFCAYYVDGLLVDAGSYGKRRSFRRFCHGRPIRFTALTHLHEDHCGNAGWLRAEGVPVYAPAPYVDLAPVEPRLPLYRRLIWGRRPAFDARPLPDVLQTPSHTFHVVAVPGHTADHVAFHEPERGWLFTGDFFLTPKPKVVFQEEDVGRTLETLEALGALDFEVLFDTHRGPLPAGPALLRKKRDYLLELRERVVALRAEGLSDEAIDRRLFPHRPLITRITGGEWASIYMVRTLR